MSKSTVDPTSTTVVLTYVGDGRSARNIPARDLTEADIARLAYQRSLAAVAADVGQPIYREDPDSPLYERPDPRKPDPKIAETVLEELLATPLYEIAQPEPAKAPTRAAKSAPPPPDDTPANPAQPEA